MKRVLLTCAVLLMAVLLCFSAAFAAGGERFYLEEMNADIPLLSRDDYYILYPGMPADSEDLQLLELTPEQIDQSLASGGILLDLLYFDGSHEFSVYVTEDVMTTELFNYSELSGLEREIVMAANGTLFDGTGVSLLGSRWAELDSGVWLVQEFEVPNSVWCCRYSTVCNGRSLIIDAFLYLGYDVTGVTEDHMRSAVEALAGGTVFRSVEASPEGVGGITGNLITSVLGEMGMDTIDLSEVGLGTVDLNEIDLSGLDLNGLVDALGLTEEEAVGIVRGEIDPTELDLSKADPVAVVEALGMEQDAMVDTVLTAFGLGDLDWRGILGSAGRGALIGGGAAVAVIAIIIILLAVCGRKKRCRTITEESQ